MGAMQNQYETFNNLIWKYCLKTDNSGVVSVRTVTQPATLAFNRQLHYMYIALLFGKTGEEVGAYFIRYLIANDTKHLRKGIAEGNKLV